MELEKSPEEGKRDSPSLDVIYQQQQQQQQQQKQQPMKREMESLEDFEDLTKDISSMKDVTAQFLQFETNDRSATSGSRETFAEDFDSQPKSSDSEPFDWAQGPSETVLPQNVSESKDMIAFMESLSNHERKQSQNNFDIQPNDDLHTNIMDSHFDSSVHAPDLVAFDEPEQDVSDQEQLVDLGMQDEVLGDPHEHHPTAFDDTKEKSNYPEPVAFDESKKHVIEEDQLVDLGLSNPVLKGLDDLTFTPKKGESSPLLHSGEDDIRKPQQETKSSKRPESPSLIKYTSEPGLAREHEPTTVQRDTMHLNKGDEGDQSDGEDIPEPIPKDYPEIGAMEGKQFLAAIGLDTWFHPDLLNPKIESLVYWRDPKKSGVVFGSVMVILLSLTTFSLISVVAYTSLLVLAAALGFRIYKNVLGAVQKTSEGHPFKPYLLAVLNHRAVSAVFMSIKEYLDIDLTLNPDRAREISDVVVSYVNWAITKSRSLFLVEDIIDSVKFGVLLWCLTYVGSWFNGLSLLIIAFVGLFTLPKVYENNKTQIDANLNIVRSKINEVTEKIKAVSPVGKKTDESKDKSE